MLASASPLIVAAAASTAAASSTSLVAHPNFFFLLTDDQDTLLGGAAHMPAVRELLVAGGANFTNAFVHTPICCPSRAELLTGKYWHNLRVASYEDSGCMHVRSTGANEQWFNERLFLGPLQRAGYAIGYFLTDVGLAILRFLGHADGLDHFRQWFAQWGLWVILIKGLTPIPYKLVTIASGLAAFSFPVFMAASVVTRGGRFFLEAWILKRWGPAMLAQVEKRLALWSGIGLVLLIALIVVLKLL